MSRIRDNINQKLKQSKPRPKSFFWARNLFFGLVIFGLTVLGGIFLASFILDGFFLVNLAENSSLDLATLFFNGLFELLLFVLICGFLGWWIYRQTDWVFVQYRLLVLAFIFALISIFATILILPNPIQDSFLDKPVQFIEILPYRQKRLERLQNDLDKQNIFIGKIVKINKKDLTNEIILENKFGQKSFVDMENLADFENWQVGDRLAIRYKNIDNQNQILEVKKVSTN